MAIYSSGAKRCRYHSRNWPGVPTSRGKSIVPGFPTRCCLSRETRYSTSSSSASANTCASGPYSTADWACAKACVPASGPTFTRARWSSRAICGRLSGDLRFSTASASCRTHGPTHSDTALTSPSFRIRRDPSLSDHTVANSTLLSKNTRVLACTPIPLFPKGLQHCLQRLALLGPLAAHPLRQDIDLGPPWT